MDCGYSSFHFKLSYTYSSKLLRTYVRGREGWRALFRLFLRFHWNVHYQHAFERHWSTQNEVHVIKAMSLLSAAAIMAAVIQCTASAAVKALATNPFNIHSGPCPHYPVVDVIQGHRHARVQEYIRGNGWCRISYQGIHDWSYSSYLIVRAAPGSIELAPPPALGIPTVSYQVTVIEPATEIARAAPVTEETVGAGPTDLEVNPPEVVETYITQHPVASVDVGGDTAVSDSRSAKYGAIGEAQL